MKDPIDQRILRIVTKSLDMAGSSNSVPHLLKAVIRVAAVSAASNISSEAVKLYLLGRIDSFK